MRVAIVGCGAIGSLFAGHLGVLDAVEVWVYDVMQAHVDAVNRDGLRLTGAADLVARVTATTDPSDLPPCEFGIVATKSMHTADAIVGMDTRGDTWLGPFEPKPASLEQVRRLAEAITRGGMNTKVLEDARGAQWTKLIFNAATNPIGALTRLTHGRVCELGETRRLVTVLVDEGKAVADSMGIALDSDPDQLVDHAAEVAYEHRASMLQDVLAQRPTEIDALNGGIVHFGREHGVPTPMNEAITALIKGLEHSWRQPRA
jgi:2-dehydropantoate 2-reductase